jgi:glycosyltransferase involved in cell wall biosynthesis
MRIAHICTTFTHASGLNLLLSLAEDQKRRGWEVEFITGRNASADTVSEMNNRGFKVTQIKSLTKYIHPLNDLKALCDLADYIKIRRFDLVHTYLAKAGIIGRVGAKIAGTKVIIHTVRGATFAPTMPKSKRFLLKSMEKLAALFSDQLVFVGQELRDGYVQAGVCTPHKASVIYNCLELSPFISAGNISNEERQRRRQAIGLGPQDIVLGAVSRIVPWKGYHYALELVKELIQEFPVKMVIVGDAVVPAELAYKHELLDIVKNFGIEKEVIFTGWQQNPAYYYSVFDIYLLTSLPLEGVSRSILEATAAGLPVVGFECYGVRETLGEAARLVASRDLPALSREVREEIAGLPGNGHRPKKNRDLLRKLQERHSKERMVREYQELYNRLLHNMSFK